MGLGGKVDDGVDLMAFEDLEHALHFINIEEVAGDAIIEAVEMILAGAVAEFIDIDDLERGVGGEEIVDKIGADKAKAAGDEDAATLGGDLENALLADALEEALDGFVDGEHKVIALEERGVETIIGAIAGEDAALLLQGKVLIGEGGIDNIAVHVKDLVMGDGAGIDHIAGAGGALLDHIDHDRNKIGEDSHGILDAADLGVMGDLCDKVARRVEIIIDGHPDPEIEDMGKGWVVEEAIGKALDNRIGGAPEVGTILLGEAMIVLDRVLRIIIKDATGAEIGKVKHVLLAKQSELDGAKEIVANILMGLLLAALEIINGLKTAARGATRQRDHTIRLVLQDLLLNPVCGVHSCRAQHKSDPCLHQLCLELSPNPSVASI